MHKFIPIYEPAVTHIHRKKKDREFPVPSRDVTTKLSLGGNNDVITELFLPRGSLVSDIPAGDGRLVNLFLRCMTLHPIPLNFLTYEEYFLFFFISADLCKEGHSGNLNQSVLISTNIMLFFGSLKNLNSQLVTQKISIVL
jgi:hypothetical protein